MASETKEDTPNDEKKTTTVSNKENCRAPLSASRDSDGHQGRTHWPPRGAEDIKHFSPQGAGPGGPPGWSYSLLVSLRPACPSLYGGPGRVTKYSGLPITEGVSGVGLLVLESGQS